MNWRPILFSADMVRAILAGRKTQTRRVVKREGCQCGEWEPQEQSATLDGYQIAGHSGRWWCDCCTSDQDAVNCPYGAPGDRLWVRENLRRSEDGLWGRYEADGAWVVSRPPYVPLRVSWHHPKYRCLSARQERLRVPSIHMPRRASRLTLKVVDVRVERLQDISEADAKAEGVESMGSTTFRHYTRSNDFCSSAKSSYRTLWESINGAGSWEKNPWVWVVEFKRVED